MKDQILNFKYPNHKDYYPKRIRNNWIKIKDHHWITYRDRKGRKKSRKEFTAMYKLLIATDPETFEYCTQTTEVIFRPLYEHPYYPTCSRLYVGTIDDASLNLWVRPLTDVEKLKLMRYFCIKKKLVSCVDTYNDLVDLLPELNMRKYNVSNQNYPNTSESVFNIDFN